MASLDPLIRQLEEQLPAVNKQLEQARALEDQYERWSAMVPHDIPERCRETKRAFDQAAQAAKHFEQHSAGLEGLFAAERQLKDFRAEMGRMSGAVEQLKNASSAFKNLKMPDHFKINLPARNPVFDQLAASIKREQALYGDAIMRDALKFAPPKINLIGAEIAKRIRENTERSGPNLAELYQKSVVDIQKAQDNKLKSLVKEMTAPKPGAALRYPALLNMLREEGWAFEDIAALTETEVLSFLEAAMQKKAGGKAAGGKAAGSKADRPKQLTKDAANKKALTLAEADPSFINLTQREWAGRIGCSVGLVAKLPLWQEVAKETGRARKGKAPKAVTLTHKLLAATADPDAELERLKAEQQADAERSPLEPDPPDRPRRNPRLRKKL